MFLTKTAKHLNKQPQTINRALKQKKYEALQNIPTLTDVLASSSEALLPPGLLLMLMRLELRAGRRMALIGRDCGEYD